MPITADRISRLREFGLSEYASRAYLALLDLGVTEARDVSTLSRVPTSKIYHVLDQLHEKGLVLILPEFPKRYAPVAFDDYLRKLKQDHEEAANAIERDREDLSNLFSIAGNVEVGDRGDFTVVRGRRNVLEKTQEILNAASREALVLGTPGFARRHEHFASELRDARSRGARVRLLLPVTEENTRLAQNLAEGAEIRAREQAEGAPGSHVAIMIADRSKAILINFLPDDGSPYSGKDIAMVTDQEGMVAALAALMDLLWGNAIPYASRLEEIQHGRLPEFARFLPSRTEALAALREALGRGASAIDVRSGSAHESPLALANETRPLLRSAGARLRAVLNVAPQGVSSSLNEAMAGASPAEIRHLAGPGSVEYMLIDDREAFFCPAGFSDATGGASPIALIVHTNNAATLKALRADFEASWADSTGFTDRPGEGERFPTTSPRDSGTWRLLDDLREGLLVADDGGRILLWNAAACALLGYDPDDRATVTTDEIFPTVPEARHWVSVARERPRAANGLPEPHHGRILPVSRKDGSTVSLDVALSPMRDSPYGARCVLVLLREAPPPIRVLVHDRSGPSHPTMAPPRAGSQEPPP